MSTMKAFGKFRMNFSLHHMLAANQFASRTGEIEQQHHGEPFGPFFDKIIVHASSSIIMAVASLEAFINETWPSSSIGTETSHKPSSLLDSHRTDA